MVTIFHQMELLLQKTWLTFNFWGVANTTFERNLPPKIVQNFGYFAYNFGYFTDVYYF